MLLQIAAWLYGSAFAKIAGEVLTQKIGVNFFPNIASLLVPAELGVVKTLDNLVFGLSILFAVLVYIISRWASKKKENNFWRELVFLFFSILFFWQVWLGHVALGMTLVVAMVAFMLFLALTLLNIKIKIEKDFVWQNAVLAGYWLMTITRLFSTSLLLALAMFGVSFLLYAIFWERFKKALGSPIQLLLLVTLFLPLNFHLVWFGLAVLIVSFVLGPWIKHTNRIGIIYDAAIVILVTYNPKFYVGNYDFIEEGVWLGWLQRLHLGEMIYRDFWDYHPPLILNFIYGITKVFGMSMYSVRLAFQILKVLGLMFYFFLLKEVIENKWTRIILLLIVIGVTTTLVRNNVEIRLGMGVLALLFWYKSLKEKKGRWIFGSGLITSLSILTSFEVGVATAVSITLGTLLFGGKERIKKLLFYIAGGFVVGLPILIYMAISSSLIPALEQLSFYSRVFSGGYFNLAVPTPPVSSYLHWSLFDEYLGSQTIGWEIARLGLLLGVLTGISKVIEKKTFDEKDKFVLMLSLFSLIIFRSALGRSDWYHLLPALMVGLVILAMVFEKSLGQKMTMLVLGVILVFFARENGLRMHLDDLLVNYQTHGQVFSKTQSYGIERMGILVDEGEEIYKLNDIVAYLEKEVDKETEVFMFPWMPDLYFFADRLNPTKNDIPYSFFTDNYQKETISDLENNPEAIVVFNPLRSFGGFDAARLILLNQYIEDNYQQVDEVGMYKILKRI